MPNNYDYHDNRIKLFDTHTHYDDEAYDDDRDILVRKMLSDNIAGFIAIGCTLGRSEKALSLAEKYPSCYASAGLHPEEAQYIPDDFSSYLYSLENIAKNTKIKAIGEIGLDYYYGGYDGDKQKKLFREQLDLARGLSLPVIIHCREAADDTLKILKEFKPRAVMHCFSGDSAMAEELVKMGIYVSFTGVITFKNAKNTVPACKAVPPEFLMLETDCPYLAPVPFRGKRCDSSMAWYAAQKIAQIKKCTTDEIVSICNKNAEKFFGIKI